MKNKPNNLVCLSETTRGVKPRLIETTGQNMGDYENINSNNRPGRRDVTLDEQRVYTQLDQIGNRLETLIRLEEKHVNLEDKHHKLEGVVTEQSTHIENIVHDQNSVKVRLARFEGLRAEVEELKNQHSRLLEKQNTHGDRLAETREKQSNIKGIMTVIGTGIVLLISLLTALGYWENAKSKNTKPAVSSPTK